jgi:hypothetical protein
VPHPNRSDLRAAKPLAPTAYVGQQYGAASAQLASQAAVPVGPPPGPPTAGAASPGPAGGPLGPDPGSLGGLLDPTARPDEPITAGLSSGAGPGPEVLQGQDPDADAVDRLRVLYQRTQSPALRRLLEAWDEPDA